MISIRFSSSNAFQNQCMFYKNITTFVIGYINLNACMLMEVMVEHSEILAVNACPWQQGGVQAIRMNASYPAKMAAYKKILRFSATAFTTNW